MTHRLASEKAHLCVTNLANSDAISALCALICTLSDSKSVDPELISTSLRQTPSLFAHPPSNIYIIYGILYVVIFYI
jgi:hypothetical protein